MVKARDIRRPFCPAGHWLSEEVNIRADKVFTCHHSRLVHCYIACSAKFKHYGGIKDIHRAFYYVHWFNFRRPNYKMNGFFPLKYRKIFFYPLEGKMIITTHFIPPNKVKTCLEQVRGVS